MKKLMVCMVCLVWACNLDDLTVPKQERSSYPNATIGHQDPAPVVPAKQPEPIKTAEPIVVDAGQDSSVELQDAGVDAYVPLPIKDAAPDAPEADPYIAPGSTIIPANRCVTRGATYQFVYYRGAGNCGEMAPEKLYVPADGMLNLGSCKTGERYHYSGCTVYIDALCTIPDGDGGVLYVKEFGSTQWQPDGSRGLGQIDFTVFDSNANQVCFESYFPIMTRL